jgi:transcriptional regulator NrdR family protein
VNPLPPNCTHVKAFIINSRKRANLRVRRLMCADCGKRWTHKEPEEKAQALVLNRRCRPSI